MTGNKSALESVHLESMPKTDTGIINPELEHRMEHVNPDCRTCARDADEIKFESSPAAAENYSAG